MSEFLDELARSMAKPIPRRRVLRLFGGALVAVAVPGAFRTPRARAATEYGGCDDPNYCPSAEYPVKCNVCRPKPGYCYLSGCGRPGSTCCCLKKGKRITGAVLCAPNQDCVPGGDPACVCSDAYRCGLDCCLPGWYCANFSQRLCCERGWRGCGLECCPPNEECRKARVGTGSVDVCTKRCPPNRAWCGKDKCCPPKWKCVNERTGRCKRCWPEEEECGKKCCDKRTSRCCGKAGCCPEGRACCNTGKEQKCCPAGQKCAIPILAGDIGPKPGTKVICCPSARYNKNPKLCCPPGMVALNSPGFRTPPPGIPPDCCPPGQVCRSGGNAFCANLQADPQNCGSCGNVCASGICSGGICALP